MSGKFKVITFYEFKKLHELEDLRDSLKAAMGELSITGTIILAGEGYNATVAGAPENIEKFVGRLEKVFETQLKYKSSFHERSPCRRVLVIRWRARGFRRGGGA